MGDRIRLQAALGRHRRRSAPTSRRSPLAAAKPALAYATDEDTRGIDPDPLANRFDLGKDTIEYAKMRAELIGELWPKIVDEVTKDGDGYQQARRAFGVLLAQLRHGDVLCLAVRRRLYVHRSHKGDTNAPAADGRGRRKQQRGAAMLEEQVFSDKPFQFPPEMYNSPGGLALDATGGPTCRCAGLPRA